MIGKCLAQNQCSKYTNKVVAETQTVRQQKWTLLNSCGGTMAESPGVMEAAISNGPQDPMFICFGMKSSEIVQSFEMKPCFSRNKHFTHTYTDPVVSHVALWWFSITLLIFDVDDHRGSRCWDPHLILSCVTSACSLCQDNQKRSFSPAPLSFLAYNQSESYIQDHFKIIGQHSLDGRSPSAEHGNVDLLFIMSWNTDTQLVAHHCVLALQKLCHSRSVGWERDHLYLLHTGAWPVKPGTLRMRNGPALSQIFTR